MDLISRQGAIRTVRRYMMDNQITDGDSHADGIERELYDLPSAEPEIIRCKDSIVYRKDVAEALYQALRTQLQGTFTDSMSLAISMAKALPSAEPERKTGKWIKTGQSFVYPDKFINYSCSECGYDIEKTKYNYCPWCGSKMDGEEDE